MPVRRRLLAGSAAVALLLFAAPRADADARLPVPIAGPDPALSTGLDAVVRVSPDDTCLSVSIDGTSVYEHRSDDLQTPASVQKVLTSATALERLDPDAGYTTSAVAVGPVEDGTLEGDLYLVGAGDPNLVTSYYRTVRRIPESQPTTLLDALARRVREAGVRRITGRVVGDESRYDAERVVSTWPERYVAQDQTGPLTALTVDDGYLLERDDDGGFRRRRSEDPPVDAARAFAAVLGAKGVQVAGGATAGSAPAGARDVATITSDPLVDVVGDLLRRSDNQAAELVLKELGAGGAGEGSTVAGAREVAGWTVGAGAAAEGSYVRDGSGLDPGNQVTCREVVRVLDASGGLEGALGRELPVAGESGTLRSRFVGSHAEGRLHGKTGSLNGVRSLAGFVELPDGNVATFAYIANGQKEGVDPLRAESFLAELLATYRPPCPEPTNGPIVVVPIGALGGAGALVGGPAALAGPALLAGADAAVADPAGLLDRCARAASTEVVIVGR